MKRKRFEKLAKEAVDELPEEALTSLNSEEGGERMQIIWDEIPVYSDEHLKVIDITAEVRKITEKEKIKDGTVNIFNPHVTSAICVNEHDPDLWEDLLQAYQKVAPLKGDYRHNAKYRGMPQEQNTHAHILNTLIGQSVSLPIREGKLILGTWQSVLFIELDGRKRRKLTVQLMGN